MTSVIIPIHHSSALGRCLDSILAQEDSLEILCVGAANGHDESHAIGREYARRHPGLIKFYLQDGTDQGSKRNFGFDRCQGDYVMFVDSDDVLAPEAIKTLRQALENAGADFASAAFERVGADGRRRSREMRKAKPEVVDVGPDNVARMAFVFPAPWGKLFRRAFIGGCRFPERPKPAYEDLIFFLRLLPRLKRCVFLPDSLYRYTVDPASTVAVASAQKTADFRADLALVAKEWRALPNAGQYEPTLALCAFIHAGIADGHRMAAMPQTRLREFCGGAREYLDANFPAWRQIPPFCSQAGFLRPLLVWIAKNAYRLGLAPGLIMTYNFLLKKTGREMKW